MRTITTTLYTLEELSPSAKEKAMADMEETMRDNEQEEAYSWAIDDCSLFEPPHKEMAALLGEDYYDRNKHGEYGQFVFKNKRKGIRYNPSTESVAIADALEITNNKMFKTWLGIPEIFHDKVEYEIKDVERLNLTSITFTIDFMPGDPRLEFLESVTETATNKFNDLLWKIADRITAGIGAYFESDNVESRLEDREFDEEGNIQ